MAENPFESLLSGAVEEGEGTIIQTPEGPVVMQDQPGPYEEHVPTTASTYLPYETAEEGLMPSQKGAIDFAESVGKALTTFATAKGQDYHDLMQQATEAAHASGIHWGGRALLGEAGRIHFKHAQAAVEQFESGGRRLDDQTRQHLYGFLLLRRALSAMPLDEPVYADQMKSMVLNSANAVIQKGAEEVQATRQRRDQFSQRLEAVRNSSDPREEREAAALQAELSAMADPEKMAEDNMKRAAALQILSQTPSDQFREWGYLRLEPTNAAEVEGRERYKGKVEADVLGGAGTIEEVTEAEVHAYAIDTSLRTIFPVKSAEGDTHIRLLQDKWNQHREEYGSLALGYDPKTGRAMTGLPALDGAMSPFIQIYDAAPGPLLTGMQVAVADAEVRRAGPRLSPADELAKERIERMRSTGLEIATGVLFSQEPAPKGPRGEALSPEAVQATRGAAQRLGTALSVPLQYVGSIFEQASAMFSNDPFHRQGTGGPSELLGEAINFTLSGGKADVAAMTADGATDALAFFFRHTLSGTAPDLAALSGGNVKLALEARRSAEDTLAGYREWSQQANERQAAAHERITKRFAGALRDGADNQAADMAVVIGGTLRNVLVDSMAEATRRPQDMVAAFIFNESLNMPVVAKTLDRLRLNVDLTRSFALSRDVAKVVERTMADAPIVAEKIVKDLDKIDLANISSGRLARKLEHLKALGQTYVTRLAAGEADTAPQAARQFSRALGRVFPKLAGNLEWGERLVSLLDSTRGMFGLKRGARLLGKEPGRVMRGAVLNLVDPSLVERVVSRGLKLDDALRSHVEQAHKLVADLTQAQPGPHQDRMIGELRELLRTDRMPADAADVLQRLAELDALEAQRPLKAAAATAEWEGHPQAAGTTLDQAIASKINELITPMLPTKLEMITLAKLADLMPERVGRIARLVNGAAYRLTGRNLMPDAAELAARANGASELVSYFVDQASEVGLAQLKNARACLARGHLYAYLDRRLVSESDGIAHYIENIDKGLETARNAGAPAEEIMELMTAKAEFQASKAQKDALRTQLLNEQRRAMVIDPEKPWSFDGSLAAQHVSPDELADLMEIEPGVWGGGPEAFRAPLPSSDQDALDAYRVAKGELMVKSYENEALMANKALFDRAARIVREHPDFAKAEAAVGASKRALAIVSDLGRMVEAGVTGVEAAVGLKAATRLVDTITMWNDAATRPWDPKRHALVIAGTRSESAMITELPRVYTGDSPEAILRQLARDRKAHRLSAAAYRQIRHEITQGTSKRFVASQARGREAIDLMFECMYQPPAPSAAAAGKAHKLALLDFISAKRSQFIKIAEDAADPAVAANPAALAAQQARYDKFLTNVEKILSGFPDEMFAEPFVTRVQTASGLETARGICSGYAVPELLTAALGSPSSGMATTLIHEVAHAVHGLRMSDTDWFTAHKLFVDHITELAQGDPYVQMLGGLPVAPAEALADIKAVIDKLLLSTGNPHKLSAAVAKVFGGTMEQGGSLGFVTGDYMGTYYAHFTEWVATHLTGAIRGKLLETGAADELVSKTAFDPFTNVHSDTFGRATSTDAMAFFRSILDRPGNETTAADLARRREARSALGQTAPMEAVDPDVYSKIALGNTLREWFAIAGMDEAARAELLGAAKTAEHYLAQGGAAVEIQQGMAARLATGLRQERALRATAHQAAQGIDISEVKPDPQWNKKVSSALNQKGLAPNTRDAVQRARELAEAARGARYLEVPEYNALTVGALPYWQQLKVTRNLARAMGHKTAAYAARAEALSAALTELTPIERKILANAIHKGQLTPAARDLLARQPGVRRALPHMDRLTADQARAENLKTYLETESELQDELIQAAHAAGLIDDPMMKELRRAGYIPHLYGTFERPALVTTKPMKEARMAQKGGPKRTAAEGLDASELQFQRDLTRWRVHGAEADGYLHNRRFWTEAGARRYLEDKFGMENLTQVESGRSGVVYRTRAGDLITLANPLGPEVQLFDLLTARRAKRRVAGKRRAVEVPTEHTPAARLEQFARLNRDLHAHALLQSMRPLGLVLTPEEYAAKFASTVSKAGPGADIIGSNFVRLPTTRRLGNLSGQYVHRQVLNELHATRHSFDQTRAWIEALENWFAREGTPPPWAEAKGLLGGISSLDQTVAGAVRWAQIIVSPATWAANITSNLLFTNLAAGPFVANPRNWGLVRQALVDVFWPRGTRLPDDVLEAIQHGVLSGSRFTRQSNPNMRKAAVSMAELDSVQPMVDRLAFLEDRLKNAKLNLSVRKDLELEVVALRQAVNAAQRGHSGRIAKHLMKVFREVASVYTGASFRDATGLARAPLPDRIRDAYGKVDDFFKLATYRYLRAQGMSAAEAAWNVRSFMQDYANVPTWVQRSSKSMLGSLVPSFHYEMTRILWNAVQHRGLRLAGMFAAVAALNETSEALAGVTPERVAATEDVLGQRAPLDRWIAKVSKVRLWNPVSKSLICDIDLGNAFMPLTGIFSQPNTLARAADEIFPDDERVGMAGGLARAAMAYAGGYVGGRPMISMAYTLLHGRDEFTGRPLLEKRTSDRTAGDYLHAFHHAALRSLVPPWAPGGRTATDVSRALMRPLHPDTGRPQGGPGAGTVFIRSLLNINVRGLPAYAVSRLLGGRDKQDAVDDRDIVKSTLWYIVNQTDANLNTDWALFGNGQRRRDLIASFKNEADPAEKARLEAELRADLEKETSIDLFGQRFLRKPDDYRVAKQLQTIEERGMDATFAGFSPLNQTYALETWIKQRVSPVTVHDFAQLCVFNKSGRWRQTENPLELAEARKRLYAVAEDRAVPEVYRNIAREVADMWQRAEVKALIGAYKKGLITE